MRARRISRWVTERLASGGVEGAVVASVHSRVVNLRLASGEFVCVGGAEVPLVANGLSADLPPGAALPRLGLTAGQPATLGQVWLCLPAVALRVWVPGARPWEPRPRPRSISAGELRLLARRARRLVVAEGALASLLPLLWTAGDEGPLPEPARSAGPPARALIAAAGAGDGDGVRLAARRLAGLGPGLTPSGDDYLAGFAAAWVLAREALGQLEPDQVPAALAAGAIPAASPLGGGWIAHAARGEVAEPMSRVFSALVGGEPEGLAGSVRGVLALGATSGTDWMVGALAGVQAVLGSSEPDAAWN